MSWCSQQVKWVTQLKCFEYNSLSNSKKGGNCVIARKCRFREYFPYINNHPSFDGWFQLYNTTEICHLMIIQQQYKDGSVIDNNSDFVFCSFRGTTQDLFDNDVICRLWEVARSASEMTTPPSLILIGTGSVPVTTNLGYRVLSSWNLHCTRSSTIKWTSCFLFFLRGL